MPVHIGEMTSDVTVFDGDLPLTPQQIDQLMQMLMQRLEEKKLDTERSQEAMRIRGSAAPSMNFGERG